MENWCALVRKGGKESVEINGIPVLVYIYMKNITKSRDAAAKKNIYKRSRDK